MKRILIVVLAAAILMGAGVDQVLEKAKTDYTTTISQINADLAKAVADAEAKRAAADTALLKAYDVAIAKAANVDKATLQAERDAQELGKGLVVPNIKPKVKCDGDLPVCYQLGPFDRNFDRDKEVLSYIQMQKVGMIEGQLPRRAELAGNKADSTSYFWWYLYSVSNRSVRLSVDCTTSGYGKQLDAWVNGNVASVDGNLQLNKGWNVLVIKMSCGGTFSITPKISDPGVAVGG